MSDESLPDDIPDSWLAAARAAAREEAQAVYGDLSVTDSDGGTWSLADVQERVGQLAPEMTRRETLKVSVVAFGYVAAGATLPTALIRAFTTPAAADADGQFGTSADPLTQVITNALTVNNSLTDPSGTSHTGELADASDIVSDYSNLSNRTHGDGDHDNTVVEDGTSSGYTVQKNGTDGAGVINFKT